MSSFRLIKELVTELGTSSKTSDSWADVEFAYNIAAQISNAITALDRLVEFMSLSIRIGEKCGAAKGS